MPSGVTINWGGGGGGTNNITNNITNITNQAFATQVNYVGPPTFAAPRGWTCIDSKGVQWIQVSPVALGYAWQQYLGGSVTHLRYLFSSETIRDSALAATIAMPTSGDNVRYFTPFFLARPCRIWGLGWPILTAGDAGSLIAVKAAVYDSLREAGNTLLPRQLVDPTAIFEAANGSNGAAQIGNGGGSGLWMVPFQSLVNCPLMIRKAGFYWVAANYSPTLGSTLPVPTGRQPVQPSPVKRDRSMASTYSSEVFSGTLASGDTADAGSSSAAATDWCLIVEESF